MESIVTLTICGTIVAVCITIGIILVPILYNRNNNNIKLKLPKDISIEINPKQEDIGQEFLDISSEVVDLKLVEGENLGSKIINITSGDEKVEKKTEIENNSLFWDPKDLNDLSNGYEKFKKTPSWNEDMEFWESYYQGRRYELGASDAAEELGKLSNSVTSWVWPLIELSNISKSAGDFESARGSLLEALARKSQKNQNVVINRIIDLICEIDGKDDCIKFSRELLEKSSSDKERFDIFSAMESALDLPDSGLDKKLIREIALRKNSSDNSYRFQSAFNYAESGEFLTISSRHYANIINTNPKHGSALNNIAVLYENRDGDIVSNSFYEEAMANGNALAACNLAQNLVNAGFIDRAKEVLSKFNDYSAYSENKGRVDKHIKDKNKELEKSQKNLRSISFRNFKIYQDFIGALWDRWIQGGVITDGLYKDDKGELSIKITSGSSDVSLTMAGKSFHGNLKMEMFAMDGYLREGVASSSLIGSEFRRACISSTGHGEISLLVFPKANEWGGLLIFKASLEVNNSTPS